MEKTKNDELAQKLFRTFHQCAYYNLKNFYTNIFVVYFHLKFLHSYCL